MNEPLTVREAPASYQVVLDSLRVRPGYKQTEVGVIPEDWDVRMFADVAALERGKFSARPRNDPKYYGGDIPFIQTGDVTNSNGDITSFSQTLNDAGLKVSKLFPRDTLFFTIAANIGDVGFTSFDTACPDSLIAITPNRQVDKRWLYHELKGRKKSFEGLATQNAQLNINLEKLRPYPLPIPPQAEQRAIAAALSDVDALLAKLDQFIAKKRDLKQAAMQQLLTGQTRLPGFSGEWEVKRLGDVFSISAGKSKSAFVVAGGKYWVVDMGSVSTDGKLIVSKATNYCGDFLSIGELVMPKDDIGGGGIIGRVGYIDADETYVLGDHVYRLIANRGNPLFLSYAINSYRINSELRKKVIGTAQLGLGRKSVDEQEVPFPQDDEQTAIATVLTDMDAEIAALEARRDKTRALKQGMMQELLTGRIRLV